MEIKGLKELEHLHKLYFHLDSGSRVKKTLRKVVGNHPTGNKYLRKELCKFLTGEEKNSYAYKTLNKCIKHDILIEVDRKPGKTKSYPLYQLDKSKLREEMEEDDFIEVVKDFGWDFKNREG